MTNTQSKTANILGAKTARACDSCLRKRARWFCAADDAFLCQNCDTSVHSANQLASRHERVRLETASCKIKTSSSWHQGFTKKPRTPRSRRLSAQQQQLHDHTNKDGVEERKTRDWNRGFLVPEISGGDEEDMDAFIIDENEEREQLLYRVPVLDDLVTDRLCNEIDDIIVKDSEFDDLDMFLNDHDASRMNDIPGFTSSDIELEDLALDSLLGTEEIEDDSKTCGLEDKMFKIEKENMDCGYDLGLDTTSDQSFNWEFDYSMSPIGGEDEEEIRIINTSDLSIARDLEMDGKEKRRINLKLNYDGVISAWDCQSSPWIDGIKPEDFSLDDCLDDFMERRSGIHEENRNGVNVGRCWDEEREAKVLRYREKRRKRLFAKKIRYQVRKLNAEKRPRMKGRFVKRTSFA